MSSADRRKQQKTKKARLQAKKHMQLQKRGRGADDHFRAHITSELRDLLTSGRARIAVATILKARTLLAAIWEDDVVQVRAYNVTVEASLTALGTAANKHVSFEEWIDFMARHLIAVADTEEKQCAISIIEWKPGEPAPKNAPTMPAEAEP